VVCVRGPSRSGKTELIRRLTEIFAARDVNVAYLKRTHHPLDLPGKGTARVWQAGPAAMVIHGVDRLQVTLPAEGRDAASLLSHVPADVDLVLLETHNPEPFPTVLAHGADAVEGEDVVARWALADIDSAVGAIAASLARLLPGDRQLTRAVRSAVQLHEGRACPGLLLGTRLALAGARSLDVAVPDRAKRLQVLLETDGCAADALQAVTGCRLGQRSLRLLDYGKLAATFMDRRCGDAVRVSVRAEVNAHLARRYGSDGAPEAPLAAYMTAPPEELFVTRRVRSLALPDFARTQHGRVQCTACGEEVARGRAVDVSGRPFCRPCASGQFEPTGCTGGTES
jgi:formylmethanofuran dehydrogenase subunit E